MMKQLEEAEKHFLALAELTEADLKALQGSYDKTSKWAKEIVEHFYEKVLSYAPTKEYFKNENMSMRQKSLEEWYLSVVSGKIDDKFWDHQWYIGLVHMKRGVKIEFLLGMMNSIDRFFEDKAFEELDPKTAVRITESFNKITGGVGTLIVEGSRLGFLEAINHAAGINYELLNNLVKSVIDEMMGQYKKPK